jgi:hypothetical protein
LLAIGIPILEQYCEAGQTEKIEVMLLKLDGIFCNMRALKRLAAESAWEENKEFFKNL